mgnify:CR=1 FL=1
MKLSDHFERIFVISLPYKPERRERLKRHLQDLGLAEENDIQWIRAVSGEMCPPPEYFKAGGGAWGCLQSHLRIVQDAIMDKLENYLVLEDDVVFHDRSTTHLERFMKELPGDWGQAYLGGQHLRTPETVDGSPFVFRGRNVNRTHAFALKSNVFRVFQQHVSHAPDYISRSRWHIDHQLGIAHERCDWNSYCPAWWIAGQEEGSSDISGRKTPRYWWHYDGFSCHLPFVYIGKGEIPEEQLESLKKFVHFGNTLKPESPLEDVGLDACVGSPGKLQTWLSMIASEAITHWKIPGICHDGVSLEEVSYSWSAGVRRLDGTDLPEITDYPMNGLFPHPINSKASRGGGLLTVVSAA